MEGSQYGYAKEIFAAVDHPTEAFPPPFNAESIPILLRVYQNWWPGSNTLVKSLVEGLNIRFKAIMKEREDEQIKKRYQVPESLEEALVFAAVDLDMSLQELMAVPEQDEWIYDTPKEYTSAELIIEAYKVLGLFDGHSVNSAEFTVRDVYQLAIFDFGYDKPEDCKEADHHLPYCQLFGDYRMFLPGYNTWPIYDHMNESCPNPFENPSRP